MKLLAPGIRYPRPISRASLTTLAFLLLSLLSAAINTTEDAPRCARCSNLWAVATGSVCGPALFSKAILSSLDRGFIEALFRAFYFSIKFFRRLKLSTERDIKKNKSILYSTWNRKNVTDVSCIEKICESRKYLI